MGEAAFHAARQAGGIAPAFGAVSLRCRDRSVRIRRLPATITVVGGTISDGFPRSRLALAKRSISDQYARCAERCGGSFALDEGVGNYRVVWMPAEQCFAHRAPRRSDAGSAGGIWHIG